MARAPALLEAVEPSGWCRPRSSSRVTMLQNRALYHGIVGNVAEAERAAGAARGLISAAQAAASMLLHDAVLAARAGRFAEVVALTGSAEATPRLQNKLLRLLRAWALLRHAAAHWPELRIFLVEHGLGDAV